MQAGGGDTDGAELGHSALRMGVPGLDSLNTRTLAVSEQPHSEPVIQCPHCQGDIKLTESLAAPFIRAREAEFKRQEAGLREAAVRRERESLERQVAEQVAIWRGSWPEPRGSRRAAAHKVDCL
jgi:hypothetical protein